MYKDIKAFTKKFNPKLDVVKDELGNALYKRDDVKNQWKTYCDKLYEKSNDDCARASIPSREPEPPPLHSEVERAQEWEKPWI